MNIDTIKMSSKGQIVIPQDIREELGFEEGTLFAVAGSGDTIVLKRITTPSKESLIKELEKVAKSARPRLQKMGVRESDLPGIVGKSRGKA